MARCISLNLAHMGTNGPCPNDRRGQCLPGVERARLVREAAFAGGLCRIRMGRHPFAGARPFPHLLSFFVHGIVRRMRTSVSYLTCPGASQHTHTNKPTRPVGEILPLREPGVPVRLGDVWNTARIITVTAMGPSVFSEMRDDRRWKWSHGFGL